MAECSYMGFFRFKLRSEYKQKVVGELLVIIGFLTGQEQEGSKMEIDGCKWFGKSRRV